MSTEFLVTTLLTIGGLIVGIIGVMVSIKGVRQAQVHPYLVPEEIPDNQPFDYTFPNVVQIRNDGDTTATNILGVIFPEQYSGQHPRGARYTLKGRAPLGKQQVVIFQAQPGGTDVPGYWMVGEYTLALPKEPEPGLKARLTLTYQDGHNRSHASIFDYVIDRGWKQIARLEGIKYDISALEKECQRRKDIGERFQPPPANGFDPRRRRLVISIGIAVVGLVATGVGGLRMYSSQKLGVGPGPSPTPSPTPAPVGTVFNIFNGHSDNVNALAWSPYDTRIASGSKDKTVKIWDALTGEHVFTYTGHSSEVNAVAWSPDGTYIASGSDDLTVRVWNATDGGHLVLHTGHTDSIFTVAWSHDGKYIASAGYDQSVQVWDSTTGKALFTYRRHTGPVYAVAWSHDSTRIASGSSDKTVQVWDAFSGGNIFTYHGHSGGVSALAWSPDGTRIASGGEDKTVQVWRASDGENPFIYRGHSDNVEAVAWSFDNARIASASDDATVQLWNASGGGNPYDFNPPSDSILTVAWQPKGWLIASGGTDSLVKIWQGE